MSTQTLNNDDINPKYVITKSNKKVAFNKAIKIDGEYYTTTGKKPEAILYKNATWVKNSIEYVYLDCKEMYFKKSEVYLFLEISNKIVNKYFLYLDNLRDFTQEFNLVYINSSDLPLKYRFYKKVCFNNPEIIKLFNLYYSNSLQLFRTKTKRNLLKDKKYLEKENYIKPWKKVGYYQFKSLNQKEIIELGKFSPTFLVSEGLKYTFGVEIETSSGYVHELEYNGNNLNMSCDHDGSIKGGEYVTNVLTGDAGFKQLHKITSFLQSRCKVDRSCGIHVHIGGTVFNKSFSVFAYLLGQKIQNDLFKMLPKSRRHNKFCSDLPNFNFNNILEEFGYKYGVEIVYNYLFKELSSGTDLSSNANKYLNHPYGRYCGQYHDVDFDTILRYKWLNLVPCNFNVRNFDFFNVEKKYKSQARIDLPFTIEFRNHSASLNYSKIKNWVLICMAFVNYVENNKNEILSKDFITVEDIIKKTYKKNSKELLKYIENRKNHFNNINEEVELNTFNIPTSINYNQLLCV